MAGNDLGSLLGNLLGGGQSGNGQGGHGQGGAGNILGALLNAFSGNGSKGASNGSPLSGLMDMLSKSGLVEQAQSWISTGQNKPVSGSQIAEALPNETLDKVAQQSGVTPQQAADEIAQSLPKAVDKLTPNGKLPKAGSLEELIKSQRM
ncbi:YidB family protein [Streptomyces sp. SCSIO 30461]|uniref:YidB family protein n=1 Tax=Streptomyces sp. SCSIO 30461 TaxID=3118085 RepID=UPI0030D44D3F